MVFQPFFNLCVNEWGPKMIQIATLPTEVVSTIGIAKITITVAPIAS